MTLEHLHNKKTSSSKMPNQADSNIGSLLNEPKLYATDLHFNNFSEDDLKSSFKEVEPTRLAVGFCFLFI